MQIRFTKDTNDQENIVLLLSNQLDLPQLATNIESYSGIDLNKYIKNQKFLAKKNEVLVIPTCSDKIKRLILLGVDSITGLSVPD